MKAISDKNTSTYVALAFIANSNKDSQQAAYYWQKAIDSLNPNQDAYNLIKRDYQEHLDSVK
jgi:cytochrome c-type biogenesis protein CcmH/NrfG